MVGLDFSLTEDGRAHTENNWRWILLWPPYQVHSLPTIPCCSHIHISPVSSKGELDFSLTEDGNGLLLD
ncbi:hypothetical protein DNTS_018901 [Danionella cerebrum]|uniref:Uncharacterized protein n=1 Tax=Danionella cerebrum TaxID=2873325 RepID=A0A553MUB4_9TELE|nr:hypothetical protein DNTS_018901 [Danionella translucida]